ncbi:hypothetical protein BN1263500277 [Stenotrophomonas indicatrix]|nr:hypothetical protein BN1263500277 [Stenotrophomonas indicatrix]
MNDPAWGRTPAMRLDSQAAHAL